jgi:hypothetical protein
MRDMTEMENIRLDKLVWLRKILTSSSPMLPCHHHREAGPECERRGRGK